MAYAPRPFYSAILDKLHRTGPDCRNGCIIPLPHHFSQVIGGTNVADAITAIKKVVFEDKKVSAAGIDRHHGQNWEGREDIRRACLAAPKFGNDDDYADLIVARKFRPEAKPRWKA